MLAVRFTMDTVDEDMPELEEYVDAKRFWHFVFLPLR